MHPSVYQHMHTWILCSASTTQTASRGCMRVHRSREVVGPIHIQGSSVNGEVEVPACNLCFRAIARPVLFTNLHGDKSEWDAYWVCFLQSICDDWVLISPHSCPFRLKPPTDKAVQLSFSVLAPCVSGRSPPPKKKTHISA